MLYFRRSRFVRLIPIVLATGFLNLTCATSGNRKWDADIMFFTEREPPTCTFEEISRTQGPFDNGPDYFDTRRTNKLRETREAIVAWGGDAVIRINRVPLGMPTSREYVVIRFTDPECRE